MRVLSGLLHFSANRGCRFATRCWFGARENLSEWSETNMRPVAAVSKSIVASILAAVCCIAGAARAADFTPPADGKLREKQVTTSIEILKEQMDSLRAAGKAAEGSKSAAANMAIMVRMGEKLD